MSSVRKKIKKNQGANNSSVSGVICICHFVTMFLGFHSLSTGAKQIQVVLIQMMAR
jgi:hypothetical protein